MDDDNSVWMPYEEYLFRKQLLDEAERKLIARLLTESIITRTAPTEDDKEEKEL